MGVVRGDHAASEREAFTFFENIAIGKEHAVVASLRRAVVAVREQLETMFAGGSNVSGDLAAASALGRVFDGMSIAFTLGCVRPCWIAGVELPSMGFARALVVYAVGGGVPPGSDSELPVNVCKREACVSPHHAQLRAPLRLAPQEGGASASYRGWHRGGLCDPCTVVVGSSSLVLDLARVRATLETAGDGLNVRAGAALLILENALSGNDAARSAVRVEDHVTPSAVSTIVSDGGWHLASGLCDPCAALLGPLYVTLNRPVLDAIFEAHRFTPGSRASLVLALVQDAIALADGQHRKRLRAV